MTARNLGNGPSHEERNRATARRMFDRLDQRAPKPPRWATDPCKNSHCIYRGTIHPEHYHTARDGSRFDRPA